MGELSYGNTKHVFSDEESLLAAVDSIRRSMRLDLIMETKLGRIDPPCPNCNKRLLDSYYVDVENKHEGSPEVIWTCVCGYELVDDLPHYHTRVDGPVCGGELVISEVEVENRGYATYLVCRKCGAMISEDELRIQIFK